MSDEEKCLECYIECEKGAVQIRAVGGVVGYDWLRRLGKKIVTF